MVMSKTVQNIILSQQENSARLTPGFNSDDEINMFLNRWLCGLTFIGDLSFYIRLKNFRIDVVSEAQFKCNSSKKIETNVLNAFIHNYSIKTFVSQKIKEFKKTHTDVLRIAWGGSKVGNKLVLYYLSQFPTGNLFFKKYMYGFNYYEIELIPQK